ncbi:hypothetical protein VTK73DRAFT_4302 [Phialemonium thermophilum]|uniref:Uncharacterized protein n=1 Tax=Phialemonium thermophilum TaxID=223376 RepID=A0ABR3V9T5_9PEZI
MQDGYFSHSRWTTSVWPAAAASMRAVWWLSLRAGQGSSWPRATSSLQIWRWPSDAARCRFELASPAAEWSGLWRRWGCERRMRWTRTGSSAWMARRRRMEGSILKGGRGGRVVARTLRISWCHCTGVQTLDAGSPPPPRRVHWSGSMADSHLQRCRCTPCPRASVSCLWRGLRSDGLRGQTDARHGSLGRYGYFWMGEEMGRHSIGGWL